MSEKAMYDTTPTPDNRLTYDRIYSCPHPAKEVKPFDCAFLKEVKKLIEITEHATQQQ